MKKTLFVAQIFATVIFCAGTIVYADVPAGQVNEVKHLLDFVKNSQCSIVRNGTEHNGMKAVKHIQKKYDYFRDEITTSEEFIELSATKSTMTKKYYTVKCPAENEILSRDWLLDELKKFRHSAEK